MTNNFINREETKKNFSAMCGVHLAAREMKLEKMHDLANDDTFVATAGHVNAPNTYGSRVQLQTRMGIGLNSSIRSIRVSVLDGYSS